jgi:thiol-disulfide isomerase/thioredoxin
MGRKKSLGVTSKKGLGLIGILIAVLLIGIAVSAVRSGKFSGFSLFLFRKEREMFLDIKKRFEDIRVALDKRRKLNGEDAGVRGGGGEKGPGGSSVLPDPSFSGKILAGSSSPLLDFVRSDYDVAAKTDKLIILYFYANWCPICREEVPNALIPAFQELSGNSMVIGFRVNYNDSDTDGDERNLARELGVAYQHTKVFVKNGRRILKAPDSWRKERYISEIKRALAVK